MHCKYIPVHIQQDATLHSLFISGNCSTCFGWYLHPSSAAHTTVSTASGICQTVTATCHYKQQVAVMVWQIPDAVNTVVCAPDDGWRYHLKHVEQFPDINKLCKVASCWTYNGIQNSFTWAMWHLTFVHPCSLQYLLSSCLHSNILQINTCIKCSFYYMLYFTQYSPTDNK